MLRSWKKTRLLLKWNGKTLLKFELLYKLLLVVFGMPLVYWIFNGTMRLTGYAYLTLENVQRYLKNPCTLLVLLLLAVILCLYELYDVSAVIYLVECANREEKTTVSRTVWFAWENLKRLLRKGNRKTVVLALFSFPFLNIGGLACVLTTVMLPNFIKVGIRTYRMWIRLGEAGLVLLAIYLLPQIYVVPYMTLEGCSYREAVRKSRALGKLRRWVDAALLAFLQFLLYGVYFLLAAMGIFLVLMGARLLSEWKLLNYVYSPAVWGMLSANLMLILALSMPVCYVCITFLYQYRKEELGEPAPEHLPESDLQQKLIWAGRRRPGWPVIFALLSVGALLSYRLVSGERNPQAEYLRTMEVTAHRGASAFYPENTMAAFEGAVEFGADWIELDVQQSRDGQIFVMHDRNFYRTTGDPHYSWELDYEEIAALDAGSHFSETFAGERIPFLAEVLEFAKSHGIRLNIELKPTGKDEGIEQRVVELLLKYDYADSCVISSQIYSSLEKVKSCNPEIQTVYVMGLAYGNINKLTAADGFSMEAGNVSRGMVSRVHNAGKQIYAWTVNNRKTINRMIDMNVDNLITDRVALVQECIYKSKTNDMIWQYVKFLRELM